MLKTIGAVYIYIVRFSRKNKDKHRETMYIMRT